MPYRIGWTELVAGVDLQDALDALAGLQGVHAHLVDAEGRQLTQHAPGTLEGLGMSRSEAERSLQDTLARCRRTAAPVVTDCPYTGLTIAAIPIRAGGRFFGAWVLDRMRMRDPNEATVLRLASRLGEARTAVRALLMKRPSVSLSAYQAALGLLRCLSRCIGALLAAEDADQATQALLAETAQQLNMTHAYLYRRDAGDGFARVQTWHREGLPARGEPVIRLDASELTESVLELFAAEGQVFAADTSLLPPQLYDFLQPMDIQSLALLPIMEAASPVGFIGMDAAAYHPWTETERALLRCVRGMLAVASASPEAAARADTGDEQAGSLRGVLDGAAVEAVVCDLATHTVLWSNRAFRAEHGFVPETEGKRCFEVLHGGAALDDCALEAQLASGGAVQEHADAQSGRICLLHHSAVQWEGGRQAYIAYVADMTEARRREAQMAHFAQTDLYTGALNQGALREAMDRMMRAGTLGTVAFVDIAGRAGQGDVLRHIVDVIRQSVRSGDLIGRMGEDALLVLFPHCERRVACARMDRAMERFIQRWPHAHGGNLTVRYGVAEWREADAEAGDPVAHLLALSAKRARGEQGACKITS